MIPAAEMSNRERHRQEQARREYIRETAALERFDRDRTDPLQDAVALIKHALVIQPAQEKALNQMLTCLDRSRHRLDALEAQGPLTVLNLASVIPEFAAIINPGPSFWNDLQNVEPLPEWCSPEWVGPWETGDWDEAQTL